MRANHINRNRVVAALPGIRTTGIWASAIAPLAAMRNFIPALLNYGYFPALWMYIAPIRNAQVRWLRNEYDTMRERTGIERPSIVAHSFGTWLLGELLRRYDDVQFDKVIITGSVLPRDYDWVRLLENKRVLAVHHEVATADSWPKWADWVSRVIRPHVFGQAGVHGFNQTHPLMTQSVQDIDHSDIFTQARLTTWLNWLSEPSIPPENVAALSAQLAACQERFADAMGLELKELRIAFLAPTPNHSLIIPHPELAKGLTDAEMNMEIPFGDFLAGKAYVKNRAEAAASPKQKLVPEAPQLAFVVAVPVRHPVDGRVLGVLGLDSPSITPNISDVSQLKLHATLAGRDFGVAYVTKSNGV